MHKKESPGSNNPLRLKQKIRNFLKKEDKRLGFSPLSETVPLLVEDAVCFLEKNGKDIIIL